jgi:hypothetical protein
LEAELAKAQEQGEAAFVCGHHPIFMSPELFFSVSPSIRVDTTRAAVEPSPLLHALLAGKARITFQAISICTITTVLRGCPASLQEPQAMIFLK